MFFVVHIVQVIRAGWNNFRAMVTGVEVVNAPIERSVAGPVEQADASQPSAAAADVPIL